MNPATRLRILCGIAAIAYLTEFGLIVNHNRTFAVFAPTLVALLVCAGPLLGVAILLRPARLLYPITLIFHYFLALSPLGRDYPIALIPSLLGFTTSLVILVLLFTFPTKQLFIPRDPDAPVL